MNLSSVAQSKHNLSQCRLHDGCFARAQLQIRPTARASRHLDVSQPRRALTARAQGNPDALSLDQVLEVGPGCLWVNRITKGVLKRSQILVGCTLKKVFQVQDLTTQAGGEGALDGWMAEAHSQVMSPPDWHESWTCNPLPLCSAMQAICKFSLQSRHQS